MTSWQEKRDWLQKQYERPEQKWTCGLNKEGCPCSKGPSKKGRCSQVTASGHPACIPTHSVRALRGMTIGWTLASTIALVLVLLFSEGRYAFINPGPLISAHASATGSEHPPGELSNCSQCHSNAHQGPTDWVRNIFDPGVGNVDANKCLDCHDLGSHPMHPHSAPAHWLEAELLSQTPNEPQDNLYIKSASVFLPNEVTCADCHREHHGRDHDITKLTNRQCQVCHQESFVSFAHGHPEFSVSENGAAYPFREMPGIIFNHQSHFPRFDQHAQETNTSPVNCSSCHELHSQSGRILTKNFNVSCTSCHTHVEQIAGTTHTPALEVLSVPGIDLKTLSQQNHPLHAWWPSGRRGSEWNPFVELLILGSDHYPDSDYKRSNNKIPTLLTDLALLEDLPRGLQDLRQANPEQIEAVTRIARSIRALFLELGQDGNTCIKNRLEHVLQRNISVDEVYRLTGGLPQETLETMSSWFPKEIQ